MSKYETKYSDFKYIGHSTPRKEARGIVTGKTTFLDDFTVPNTLIGRCLRCPHPHAMIKSINVEKAKQVKGVHAVLTYKDVNPAWNMGWPPIKPILDEHLRFVGDPVAFIAADTAEIADEAVELIEVEYEILPASFTGWDAIQDDAAQLYPGIFQHNEVMPGFPPFQPEGPWWHLERGNVEKGFEECAYIAEDRVEYNKMPSPMAPEPPEAIVRWDEDLNFKIWTTTQGTMITRAFLGALMPTANFKVEAFNVGGSYGNKETMSAILVCGIVLSMATRRPVKVKLTKTEQLLCHEIRLGSQIQAKIGMDKDGVVKAVKGKWVVDTGYISMTTQGQVCVGLGEANLIMGKCPNWDLDSQLIATNKTPAGIARGYGGMELNACLNILMCRTMEAGGFDPVEVYKKNYISDGDRYQWRDGIYWKAHTVDYKQIIQACADKFGWKDKWKGWGKPSWVSPDGKRVRGIGCGVFGNADASEDNNEAYVKIDPYAFSENAHVVLVCDIPESGQGTRSNAIKMVAEILNIKYEDVDITPIGSGDFNPNGFGLCGSRGTITYGRAVCNAAEEARRKLFELAEPVLHVPVDTMVLDDYGVRAKHRPERFVKWKDLLPHFLTLTAYGKHLESFGIPSCVVNFAEVEVDLETGKYDVIRMIGGSDVGQIIDPKSLEMQFHGGIGAAAMDSAVYEEGILDTATGRNMSYNMIEHKWRPFNNFPEFETEVMESQFDTFQFKAVGIGEITGASTAPVILQAISNAVGVHVSEYPATPQVILKALGKL